MNVPAKFKIIAEGISSFFILLFIYTALSKMNQLSLFKSVLFQSPFIGKWTSFAALLIPLTELVTAVLLFFPLTRRKGLAASFILMGLFTFYVGYMVLFTPDLPCSCGGIIKQLSWKEHFIFNSAASALAFIGLMLENVKTKGKAVLDYTT